MSNNSGSRGSQNSNRSNRSQRSSRSNRSNRSSSSSHSIPNEYNFVFGDNGRLVENAGVPTREAKEWHIKAGEKRRSERLTESMEEEQHRADSSRMPGSSSSNERKKSQKRLSNKGQTAKDQGEIEGLMQSNETIYTSIQIDTARHERMMNANNRSNNSRY